MAAEDKYQRAYERERKARQLAESILNEKTREVYDNLVHIQSQNKALELLIEVTNFSKEDLSFSASLFKYLVVVAKLLESPYGLVYLKSEDDEGLYTSDITYPDDDSFPKNLKVLVDESQYFSGKSIPGQVLKTKQMFLWRLGDNDNIAPQRIDIFKALNLAGSVSVPIIRFDQVVAVVELGVKKFDIIDDFIFDKIQASATQLGITLERRKQQKALTKNYLELKKTHDELKTAQQQLVQSEKMSSLGQIAAGIAHEINNPIGFVTSNLETLKEYIDVFVQILMSYNKMDAFSGGKKLDEMNNLLEEIRQLKKSEDFDFMLEDLKQILADSSEGLSRVRDIVANLKTFAHADDGVLEEHDINECLKNSIKVVWNELKYTITLHEEFNEIPHLICNISELSQVFMNMLINAKDACGEQGEMTVSTQLIDGFIEIRFADNGEGIPQDKLKKIFDPFFTTKPVGKGTGLGLSISYGIIESHGGGIDVETEEGKGTCFIIKLPVKREES